MTVKGLRAPASRTLGRHAAAPSRGLWIDNDNPACTIIVAGRRLRRLRATTEPCNDRVAPLDVYASSSFMLGVIDEVVSERVAIPTIDVVCNLGV